MTKPTRDHDRKVVRRVVRIVELRMRKRDQQLKREIFAAVAAMVDGHRLYDASDPKKGGGHNVP